MEGQWNICYRMIQESWFRSPFYFDWLCGLGKRFFEFQLNRQQSGDLFFTCLKAVS